MGFRSSSGRCAPSRHPAEDHPQVLIIARFTFQGLDNLVTEEKQAGGTAPATKTFSYDSFGHKIGMIDRDNGTGATDSYTLGRDVHGSISQLLDDTGTVTASYGYDAYGGQDAPSSDSQALTTGDTNNQAPVNPYRYAEKRADSGTATSPSSTAQLDMGSRRYGPDTTRFLQQDQFAGALADLGLAADPLTQNRYGLAGGARRKTVGKASTDAPAEVSPRDLALPDVATLDRLVAAVVSEGKHRCWGDMVTLLATTTMRISEVAGLRVGDLDLDHGVIHVERQTYPGRGGLITKATEGRRRRVVPVIDPLRATLVRLTRNR